MTSKLEELFAEFMPEIEFIDDIYTDKKLFDSLIKKASKSLKTKKKTKNNKKLNERPAFRFIDPLEDYIPLIEVKYNYSTIAGIGRAMIDRLKNKDMLGMKK